VFRADPYFWLVQTSAMFDFDVGKLLIVGIVALLVVGPKDLPRVLRTVGQVVGKMRRMAAEFQGQFMDAIKEADLEDVKKELHALGDSAKIDASFDPTTLMRQEMTSAVEGSKTVAAASAESGAAAAAAVASPEMKEYLELMKDFGKGAAPAEPAGAAAAAQASAETPAAAPLGQSARG